MAARTFRAALLSGSALLAGIAWAAAARGAEGSAEWALAWPVEGRPFPARLVAIDADWHLTLDDGRGRRRLAAADLIRWGAYRDREGQSQILLGGKTVLMAEVLSVAGDRITAQSELWGEVRLPRERVRGIVLRPPADPLERDRLIARLLAAKGAEDTLLLENGDRVSGQLSSPPTRGPAPPGGGNDLFRLETDRGQVAVAWDKVVAISLNPALYEAPPPRGFHAFLGLADGSGLLVQHVIAGPDGMQMRLPGGIELRILPDDPTAPCRAIVYLRPASPRVQYVSDLRPLGYKHVPFLDLPWPYGIDQNVLGGRLRAQGHLFDKGLSMHSASRLAYRLDGKYDRFEAELAIDELAGRRGSVVYRVFLDDGSGQWKRAYQSETILGGQKPKSISVDLTGARRMALLVDFADHGDTWDHADWLNARLIKPAPTP